MQAIVELGRACVVERIESRPPGLPVLLALRPPTPTAKHPQMILPFALQDIEVYAASASDYDHLLGNAA